MFSFLFFIIVVVLFFALAIVVGILNTVFGVFRGIFSFGRKNEASTGQTSTNYSGKKKVFDNSEGEYVDFEEIKDK